MGCVGEIVESREELWGGEVRLVFCFGFGEVKRELQWEGGCSVLVWVCVVQFQPRGRNKLRLAKRRKWGKRCGAGSPKEFQSGEKEKNFIGAGDRGSLPTALGTRPKMAPNSPPLFAKLGMRRNRSFHCEEGLYCRLETRKRRPMVGAESLIFSRKRGINGLGPGGVACFGWRKKNS